MSTTPRAEPYVHDGGPIGVVVSHGFTGSVHGIRPWAEHLAAAGYTVRAPLLPGHGTTWQDLNTTRWPQWYAAVEEAFTDLRDRCQTVFVAGLSMGGALVTMLAQDHGPRVAGLILVNPAYRVDDPRMRALPVLQRVLPSLPGIGNDIKMPGVLEGAYDRIPLKALYSQTQFWSRVVRDLLGGHPADPPAALVGRPRRPRLELHHPPLGRLQPGRHRDRPPGQFPRGYPRPRCATYL